MKQATAFLLILCATSASSPAAELTRHGNENDGLPTAVSVKRGGLAHTRLFVGKHPDNIQKSFQDLLNQLDQTANLIGARKNGLVKLNLYVADDDPKLVSELTAAIKAAWPHGQRPAVTLISTPFGGEGSIAGDAVFAVNSKESEIQRFGSDVAVIPPGRDIIYVSGRAAPGNLSEASTATMKQLFDVISHFGSTPADVIQVKAFINSATDWQQAAAAIKTSFGEHVIPPTLLVEWQSTSWATEIELIAVARDESQSKETVTFFTPPGDKASPVYSKVARVHSNELIFTSGLTGTNVSSPELEVRSIYDQLRVNIADAKSDFRHLAKATYYVSKDESSAALNQLRPEFYDPQRPPAASKIAIPSVLHPNRGLLLDMVAVPIKE